MKRTFSIAGVTLVGAFVAGVIFLLPPRCRGRRSTGLSFMSRPCWKGLGVLPHQRSATIWTTSPNSPYAGQLASLASLTFFVLSASQQTPRKRFLLIRQSAGPAFLPSSPTHAVRGCAILHNVILDRAALRSSLWSRLDEYGRHRAFSRNSVRSPRMRKR
jgi:hypothetical protein